MTKNESRKFNGNFCTISASVSDRLPVIKYSINVRFHLYAHASANVIRSYSCVLQLGIKYAWLIYFTDFNSTNFILFS